MAVPYDKVKEEKHPCKGNFSPRYFFLFDKELQSAKSASTTSYCMPGCRYFQMSWWLLWQYVSVCRYALQYVPVSVLASQRQPLGESNQVAGDIISSETVNSRRLTDRTGSVFSSSFPLSPEEADQTDEKWINLWIPSYFGVAFSLWGESLPSRIFFFPPKQFSVKRKTFFFLIRNSQRASSLERSPLEQMRKVVTWSQRFVKANSQFNQHQKTHSSGRFSKKAALIQ